MRVPEITLAPDFVRNAGALFDHLVVSIDWDERMRARKTASFGVSYDYSQISYPQAPMPGVLAALAHDISARLGFQPNNCLLNYYADGEASMGFHSDSSEELAPDTGVSIISLGATRPIIFRLKGDRSVEHAIELTAGSLLHMPNAIQTAWLHAIPRSPGAGPRISATFRKIIK